MGFSVAGLGFRVGGVGRVEGSKFRGLGFRVWVTSQEFRDLGRGLTAKSWDRGGIFMLIIRALLR